MITARASKESPPDLDAIILVRVGLLPILSDYMIINILSHCRDQSIESVSFLSPRLANPDTTKLQEDSKQAYYQENDQNTSEENENRSSLFGSALDKHFKALELLLDVI